MKIVLNPRSAEAFGQDFLGSALRDRCDFTALTATNGTYSPVGFNLTLVVSMNPDENVDSDFIQRLPADTTVVAHVHCRYHYYSADQKANLTASLKRVHFGIVPANFLRDELTAKFPEVDWRVAHNGVSRERFAGGTDADRRRFRASLGLDQEASARRSAEKRREEREPSVLTK